MVVRADWPTDVEARLRSVTRHPTTPGHWAASSLKQSFPKGKHCGGQEFQGSVLDMRVMRELFWVAVLIPKLVDFLMRKDLPVKPVFLSLQSENGDGSVHRGHGARGYDP